MNKVPRVAAGVLLGAGAFYLVHEGLERPPLETHAVNDVRDCANALGNAAMNATAVYEACQNYENQFKPTQITNTNSESRQLTFKLPKPLDLLNSELANAINTDRSVINQNRLREEEVISISIMAAGIVGFGIGKWGRLKS